MKTLTEFDGFVLRRALARKKEISALEGKTPEELATETQTVFGQEFKMEGDKLSLFIAALDFVPDQADHLKRVRVFSLNEGEQAPQGSKEKDGKHFSVEFYFTASPQKKSKGDKDGRDDKRGGRNKGGKKFSKKKEGDNRDNRGRDARANPPNPNAKQIILSPVPAKTAEPKAEEPKPAES